VKLSQDLDPASTREHQIEYDKVDVLTQRFPEPGVPVKRGTDLKPFGLESSLDEVDDPRLR
jgi:hypothetical protein